MVVFSITVVRIAGLHPAYCTKVASEAAVDDATECTGERMKKPGSSGNSYVRVPATRAKAYSRRLVSVLGFVVLTTLSVTAQIKPNGRIRPDAQRKIAEANIIRRPTVRATTLNRGMVETLSRPPIAFKAFEMVDPATRKPIPPTAILTLPNGKRPTAKQYYDELNTFEKWLSEHGYSLRTSKPGTPVVLHQIKINRAALQRQVQLAPKPTTLLKKTDLFVRYSDKNLTTVQPLRFDQNLAVSRIPRNLDSNRIAAASKVITANGVRGAQRDGMVINSPALSQIARLRINPPPPPAPGPQCQHMHDDRPWNWDVGDPSTFHAYVNGTLSLTGDACRPPDMQKLDTNQSHFNVTAEGKAGGEVFGIGGDLLRVTSNLGGDQASNTVTAGMGVFVLGVDILNINKSATGHWGIDDQISKGLDFSTSLPPIPVGPFDIDVTIGARGEAGFHYGISLVPNNLSISGGPFVHSSIYAQAGLNIVVAEAGMGVTLTLVNWDMNLNGSVGYGWFFKFYVTDEIYVDSNLNLLSGNVYVYAKVVYPCFGLPPWCWAEYDHTLWSWNGLNFNSVLFDERNTVPLNW
jgi:hypothetical protein